MRIFIHLFVFLLFVSSQLFFINFAISQENAWNKIPLRSKAQYDAGLFGGEGFQMVQSICYAPSNPSTVYFCTDSSQVWKSTDGGFSWESKRNGFKSIGGVSLVVDPGNENVVFVSGMKADGGSPVDGIYRTLDGGDSWTLVKQTFYSKSPGSNKKETGEGQHYAFDSNSFDGTRHQIIYAGTHSEGLLKSTDGGDTWTVIGLAGIRIFDIDLVSIDGITNTLYVATNNTSNSSKGFYMIVDDGISTPTVTPLGNLPDYPRTIAIDTQSDVNNVIIYAAVGTYKVYKSTDSGNTFSSQSNGLDLNCVYRTISISPANPNFLYVKVQACSDTSELNPYYSIDGGATWHPPSDLNVGNLDIQTIWPGASIPVAPHPDIADVALGCMLSSMRETTDGGDTWHYSGNGYMGARRPGDKTSVYFDPSDSKRRIYFLLDFGPAMTEDDGNTWRLLPVPPNNGKSTPVGAVDPSNPDIIITAVGSWGSQYIISSTDRGNTWTKYTKTSDNYQFMSFHPQNVSYVYAGAGTGSWISKDKGNSWKFLPDKSIRAVFPRNGNILYAFEKTADSNSSLLWFSRNKGRRWTQIATNPFGIIKSVDIDSSDFNILYVAANNGLFVFDGAGWNEIGISNGIPSETFGNNVVSRFKAVVVDPVNPNIIYTGMRALAFGHYEKFIFRSQDYGNSWEDIRYNLEGYSSVHSLSVDPISGDLHMCSSHGNYVLAMSQ